MLAGGLYCFCKAVYAKAIETRETVAAFIFFFFFATWNTHKYYYCIINAKTQVNPVNWDIQHYSKVTSSYICMCIIPVGFLDSKVANEYKSRLIAFTEQGCSKCSFDSQLCYIYPLDYGLKTECKAMCPLFFSDGGALVANIDRNHILWDHYTSLYSQVMKKMHSQIKYMNYL